MTSPPYYGARNYATVNTLISLEGHDNCMDMATSYLDELHKRYPRDIFYQTAIKHFDRSYDKANDRDIPERWQIDVCIDITTVWGGNYECNHEWEVLTSKLQHSNTNGQHSNAMHESKANNANAAIISRICVKCGAWKGSLGNEPSVEMYIDHMLMVTSELQRVMKPTGFLMLNIGDTYGGDMGKMKGYGDKWNPTSQGIPSMSRGGRRKSLLLVPQRLVTGLYNQGWIIRNDNVWKKPNHKPESCLDRRASSHEYIYFATKSEKYYWNLDAIREPYSSGTIKRISQSTLMTQKGGQKQRTLRGEKSSPNDNGSRAMDMVRGLAIKLDKHHMIDAATPRNNHSYGGLSNWAFTKQELATGRVGNVSYTDSLHRKDWDIKKSKYIKNYGQDQESYTRGMGITDRMSLNYETKFGDGEAGKSLSKYLQTARSQSYKDAAIMFPDSIEAQREYVRHIHDHPHAHIIGKNPGDVMTISTGSYKGEHTAVFPVELALQSLLPGPRRICSQCGSPERLESYNAGISSTILSTWGATDDDYNGKSIKNYDGTGAETPGDIKQRIIRNAQTPKTKLIWKGCAHNAGYSPAVVLDPFMGAGTTFIASRLLNVSAIGIEINSLYIEQIKNRVGWGQALDIEFETIEDNI